MAAEFLSGTDWVKGRHKLMFIGETGSGKSELALQTALSLAAAGQAVHVFDMDQSKPLFRMRDQRRRLEEAGIAVHAQEQYLDAPVLVGGVEPALKDPDAYTILDVGGGEQAARMVGGFSAYYADRDAAVIYVINPYRAFGGSAYLIQDTLTRLLRSARLRRIHVAANPYLGADMTAEEYADGLEKTREMTDGYASVEFACVPDFLWEEAESRSTLPLVRIHRSILYPWEEERENDRKAGQGNVKS